MTFKDLYLLVQERKKNLPEGSSTTFLMNQGLNSILPKLNEECFEVGLALEYQEPDDIALEVSQSFYYIICLAVFLDEPFDALKLEDNSSELDNKHELSKKIAQTSASICHTPCLASLNQLPTLLFNALNLGHSSKEQMLTYL